MSNKPIIKLDFCGFWGSLKKKNNLFYNLLSKHFDVEISDNPDFVICSNRGKPFEYMKYDCPRIMFMGENQSPDFTVFDYVYQRKAENKFNFMCIINKEKFDSFENTEDLYALASRNNHLCIKDVRIKNPNNPAQLKEARLITFEIEE